jgi:cysteine synthase A
MRYSMRYLSILETVGNTPCVRLQKIGPAHVNLFVKLESFNPTASVKDRMALGVIEQAEKSGALKPGQTVVEATSGNAGISLAMVCAHKGYPLVVVMPENFSVERRKLIRFFGARVVLTPAGYKGSGALAKAQELAERHGWFYCRQFDNDANANAHARTTAKEILRDFQDAPLNYWVTGYGSGGTLKGVAQMLKAHSPKTRVVVCEPNNAQLLANSDGETGSYNNPPDSHSQHQPHLMQGWTPDFISRLTEDAQREGCIDQLLPVDGNLALQLCRDLARQEGILTGISGGATLAGALQLAAAAEPGSNILCMLPDTAERYLTTPLFDAIDAEMDGDEIGLSDSTPNFRFAAPPSPLPVMEVEEQEAVITEITQQMLMQFIENRKRPVVMFALEWCEFCWSVRKLFKKLSIPFHSVDLDSAAYQSCGLGAKLKATLVAHTGCSVLPQIFIAGEYIGSCIELFDAVNSRSLYRKLDRNGIAYNKVLDIDPYTLLPGWLHSARMD